MSKFTVRLIIGLLTFLLGIYVAATFLFEGEDASLKRGANDYVQGKRELHLKIPDGRWEPVFFNTLDELTGQVGLRSLRTVLLPNNDLEVRVWFDGRPYTIDGVVLRRATGEWSAIRVHGRFDQQQIRTYQDSLASPTSGWESMWQRLVEAGILTLPDASEVECRSGGLDGVAYVVEVNMNQRYRTYAYSNPQLMQCREAKQMLNIKETIATEFALESSSY